MRKERIVSLQMLTTGLVLLAGRLGVGGEDDRRRGRRVHAGGDSDLDLLVGDSGGTVYHFKNTGTITEPIWTEQTSSYGGIGEASGATGSREL